MISSYALLEALRREREERVEAQARRPLLRQALGRGSGTPRAGDGRPVRRGPSIPFLRRLRGGALPPCEPLEGEASGPAETP